MANTLYRKYRPSAFSGVVGQEHITTTLQNQLLSGRIGHAYLFCGSRGVGKTSLARIFAKAVNCVHPDHAPCGKCKPCLESSGDANLDIIEIDAASNNGVDDARDLRDKVKYPPILGKYKVYIIDEAHMLTGSAFNALLKTLEEPPAHAVFILATTEPHKLPATILSRCMRFDFRLVGMQELFILLSKIYLAEGKQFEDEAVRAIAAAAEGSVRDALSLADTCIALNDGVLTAADVDAVLGGGSRQTEQLFDAITACDLAAALVLTDELYTAGKSMSVIAKELGKYARDLMVALTAPRILKTTLERRDFLVKAAANHTVGSLAALVQIFAEADNALRYSVSPRVAFEALVIRAVKLCNLDLSALDQRILRVERRLDALALNGNNTSENTGAVSAGTTKPAAQPVEKTQEKPQKNEDLTHYPEPPPDSFNDYNIPPDNALRDGLRQAESTQNAVKTQKTEAGGAQGRPLTAIQLWGRVITYFRRNSTPALTQVIGRHNPQRLRLTTEALTVFASREDYLIMCDSALIDTLKNALLSEGLSIKIVVEKDSLDVDLEKEVLALNAEFGKNKVNIIK